MVLGLGVGAGGASRIPFLRSWHREHQSEVYPLYCFVVIVAVIGLLLIGSPTLLGVLTEVSGNFPNFPPGAFDRW